jgi:molecular chaperone GrpE
MTRRSRKDKEKAGLEAGNNVAEGAPLDPEVPPAFEPEMSLAAQEPAAAAAAPSAEEAERAVKLGEEIVQEIETLRAEREQLSREATEARDKYLRSYADFENYRKRMQRDQADFRKYANEQLALDLLSVADHLTLAIMHASEGGEPNQALVQGVELVHKQLLGILEKYGIKPFKAVGEPFNPAMHDAMMQVESADLPENTVAQVFMEGYLYHDRVLRHAKVGVTKRPSAGAAPVPAEPAAAEASECAAQQQQEEEEGPRGD